jgi:hypothetical protein
MSLSAVVGGVEVRLLNGSLPSATNRSSHYIEEISLGLLAWCR